MIIGASVLPKSVDGSSKDAAQEKSRPEGLLEKFWERMPERQSRLCMHSGIRAIAGNAPVIALPACRTGKYLCSFGVDLI